MEVRPANENNLTEIVKVHKSAFPSFFLTELGNNFLKLYYKSVLNSDVGILLVCLNDDKVIGFCAACTKSNGFHYKLIKKNPVGYIMEGIRLLFIRPKALKRLYNNLSKTNSDVIDNGDYAELMSIGVKKDIQGKGVGQALLFELEKSLKNICINRLSLTTDVSDNEKTLNFYKKSGFVPMYKFISYPSREMYRLIKNLKL